MNNIQQSPLWDFCGFANGTSFRTKYFFDESTMTLTPCGEFGIVMAQSLPLLFFTVLNLLLIPNGFSSFAGSGILHIFTMKVVISVLTVMAMISYFPIVKFTSFHLKPVTLIEYAIIASIWTAFASMLIYSKIHSSWTRSRGLSVATFFASKVFVLITVNRWILYGVKDPRTYILIAVTLTHLFIGTTLNYVEWRLHRSFLYSGTTTVNYVELQSSGDESVSFLSRIFFCWANELIQKGSRLQLNSIDDVFLLPPSLEVATIEREMIENSPTFYSDGQQYSLSSSLISTFGWSFFSLAILRLASDAFTFASPILLHLLVDVLEDPVPNPMGFLYAGLMVLFSLLAAFFSTNFNFYVNKIGLKVRAACITTLYDKLLMVPATEMNAFSSGAILNFVSTDVDRVVNFCNSFHAFWSLPVQLTIALYLLYREVGMAFLAGVLAALILIPINKWVTNSIGRMSVKLMHCKDQRIKVVRETIEGIRAIKSSAWESFFEMKINEMREKELYYLKIRKYLDAVCVYMWASAPLLITISILTTYTMVFHLKLTAAKVFTSIALVNILIMPLNAFPWVLNGIVEASVSLRRLQRLFAMNNVDVHDVYRLSQVIVFTFQTDDNTLLYVKAGNFFWRGSQHMVSDVSFHGKRGKIIGIFGSVGSGKSTLLLGLLGETKFSSDAIGITQDSISNGIGYLAQERWLFRGSVRDNILAGKELNPQLYDEILKITCLQRDINLMPGGDLYEISDNGGTLSGGQRTRVALARALYQENSVYILDEPFASLDRNVANTIWVEAIEKTLRDRGCLVIVATHDRSMLARADEVIVLGSDGKVLNKGVPEKIFCTEWSDFDSVKNDSDCDEDLEHIILQEEEKQAGTVKALVVRRYIEATGRILTFFIIAALFLMQFSKNAADWWLSRWTQDQHNSTSKLLRGPEMDRSLRFLTIYAAIAAANTVFTLIRAFLFAYGGILAAKYLHFNLLRKLLMTSMSWWDRTPSGRVINRICSDVYTCDDSLPFQLNILLASLFNLAGTLVITVMGLPYMLPVFVVLLILYYFIQRYYRFTTVELKRLASLSLSPLYSHYGDTVNGLPTIRAQRFVERFAKTLRERLTMNMRAQYSSIAADQWLSVRLSIISLSVVTVIALMSVIEHELNGVDTGMIALALTYALSLTSLLNGLLGSLIETEKEMVSVERIDDYLTNVTQEDSKGDVLITTSDICGNIEFCNVSLRYNSYLPLALENVNISIQAGQKVAIMGRTGSGKSSLLQALLRIVNIEFGQIRLDGLDITSIPLNVLRRVFGVVPQHPFIFSGSLYENLVVGYDCVDRNEVATIARAAQLESLITRIGGLEGQIEEGGKNLSFGERQIISICRVLLAKCKIVLIDEATSHLDETMHNKIMSLIIKHLPNATIICVTHVLHGLSEFDTVIEMANGRVISQKPPSEELLNRMQT